jgi:hypothetical protein
MKVSAAHIPLPYRLINERVKRAEILMMLRRKKTLMER